VRPESLGSAAASCRPSGHISAAGALGKKAQPDHTVPSRGDVALSINGSVVLSASGARNAQRSAWTTGWRPPKGLPSGSFRVVRMPQSPTETSRLIKQQMWFTQKTKRQRGELTIAAKEAVRLCRRSLSRGALFVGHCVLGRVHEIGHVDARLGKQLTHSVDGQTVETFSPWTSRQTSLPSRWTISTRHAPSGVCNAPVTSPGGLPGAGAGPQRTDRGLRSVRSPRQEACRRRRSGVQVLNSTSPTNTGSTQRACRTYSRGTLGRAGVARERASSCRCSDRSSTSMKPVPT
jgi:hypothetical protein